MRPSGSFWIAMCFIVGFCCYQSGAQGPSDCSAELVSLLPCLDYVRGNVSAPPQTCCIGVGNVVKSNPTCLCALFNGSALPVEVNSTRALQLPALCSVATSNPSLCGGSTPVQSPPTAPPATPPSVSPPTPSPPTAPATPPSVTASPPVVPPPPPSVAPSAPMTPSVAPSVTPTVAPSVAPTVAPSLAPVIAPSAPTPTPATVGVPGPSPAAATPVGTPISTPATTPTGSATSPTGSASSPPAPPPATDENFAAPFVRVSLLSVAIVVSNILFLQL